MLLCLNMSAPLDTGGADIFNFQKYSLNSVVKLSLFSVAFYTNGLWRISANSSDENFLFAMIHTPLNNSFKHQIMKDTLADTFAVRSVYF